jgi:acetolactate synthase-1/2/3 large subunit
MTAQELATAARYEAGLVTVVVNNGMYGTIRMHQENSFPGRVSGTMLTNPDFGQLGQAFGCWTRRAHLAEEVIEAFADCLAHPERRSLIEIVTPPERITPSRFLRPGGGLSAD